MLSAKKQPKILKHDILNANAELLRLEKEIKYLKSTQKFP